MTAIKETEETLIRERGPVALQAPETLNQLDFFVIVQFRLHGRGRRIAVRRIALHGVKNDLLHGRGELGIDFARGAGSPVKRRVHDG